MSPYRRKGLLPAPGFPRVSGDEPRAAMLIGAPVGFSPRERG